MQTIGAVSPKAISNDQNASHQHPMAYRINDAAKVSGLGRTKLYELINSRQLRSVMRGGRRLILREDLEVFLRGQADE